MQRGALAIALLLLLVTIAHGAVVTQWWLWDDPQLLYGVMRADAIDHLVTREAWRHQTTASFTPMLMLANELDLALFGLNPRGFYIHHLLVFAGAIVAVYAYARRLIDNELFAAIAAGALALSQPAFTVATLIMDRHYASGLLLAALAMICFHGNRPVLGTALYFLACLAKEVYVPLPLLIVVQDIVRDRARREVVRDAVLSGVAASVYLIWRMAILGSFGGYGSAKGSVSGVLVEGWTIVAGSNATAAVAALIFSVILFVGALKRKGWRAALIVAASAVVVLVPIAQLTPLDSRYLFVAVTVVVVLSALAARTRVEQLLFGALCVAIAVGGTMHGLRFRKDLSSWQRDGLYVWTAPSGANPLFTGANGWYIEGIQWLRRTVKKDQPPPVISSIPGFVIAGVPPPPRLRRDYEVIRAHAVGDMPLTVELTLRGSVLHWSFGPAEKGDAFFFVTPNYELIWTRTPVGWVRLPADVRVPTATSDANRRVRVMRRSGNHWTVSTEVPLPKEGTTIRWQRGELKPRRKRSVSK